MFKILTTITLSAVLLTCSACDDDPAEPQLGPFGWERQVDAPGPQMQDVFFVDQSHGWVTVPLSDTLYFTQDGGANWQKRHYAAEFGLDNEYLNHVYFLDRNKGFATSRRGDIYRSDDGGLNWQVALRWGDLDGLDFPTPDFGVAVQRNGATWYKSEDAGINWEQHRFLEAELEVGALRDIAFRDKTHGVITAYNYAGNVKESSILITVDGGQTWETQVMTEHGDLQDINIFGDDIWLTTGEEYLLHSPDFGQNWQKQEYGVDRSVSRLFFLDRLRGWLLLTSPLAIFGDARSTSIMFTNDGGLTWQAQNLEHELGESHEGIADIHFVDQNTGWAVGFRGQIFHTSSGGQAE